MKKQLLFLAMLLMPMLAWADDNGSCGASVTYTYTSATKTLVISGTGKMTDYSDETSYAPWFSYRTDIQTVIIENGVKSIGSWAFARCSKMTSVTIPNSVTAQNGKTEFSLPRSGTYIVKVNESVYKVAL